MSRAKPIRALVIDDSAFSRQAITRMLQTSPLVEVVGAARDGEEALRKTLELQPDLITVDLEMPKMDGFTFLRIVMAKRPTPVIVISGRNGEDDVFKALELGAVDFIAKPTPHATPMLSSIAQELLRKVHAIRELRIEKVQERIRALPPLVARHADHLDQRRLLEHARDRLARERRVVDHERAESRAHRDRSTSPIARIAAVCHGSGRSMPGIGLR